jgi:hypothetical protein
MGYPYLLTNYIYLNDLWRLHWQRSLQVMGSIGGCQNDITISSSYMFQIHVETSTATVWYIVFSNRLGNNHTLYIYIIIYMYTEASSHIQSLSREENTAASP